jgi:hypothetical protein
MEPTLIDLNTPAFLDHLRATFPDGKILPDDGDFVPEADPQTDAECALEYRLAQARTVTRLWQEWKAAQKPDLYS